MSGGPRSEEVVGPSMGKGPVPYLGDGYNHLVGTDFVLQAFRKSLYGNRFLEVSYDYIYGNGWIEILIGATGSISLAEELYPWSVADEEMARYMAYFSKIDPTTSFDISYVVPESMAIQVLNDQEDQRVPDTEVWFLVFSSSPCHLFYDVCPVMHGTLMYEISGGNGDERRNDIKELAKAIQESSAQRDQLPKVDVPLFDGNHASGWAENFEQIASCREWTESEMLQKVKRYCKRAAPTTLPQVRRTRKALSKETAARGTSRQPVEEVLVPDDEENNSDKEDERLRAEDERQVKQRASEQDVEKRKEAVEEEEPRRKKNIYIIPVEKGFDIEQIVDRMLKRLRDLVTLKEFLAASPKICNELKQRLTRRKVMIIKFGDIIPLEANWAPAGTKMNWRCVVTGLLQTHVGQGEFTAVMHDGAEMNIIREKKVMEAGIRINRVDTRFLIGASGSTVFCGMANDVMVSVGRDPRVKDETEELPGSPKFVWEHIRNVVKMSGGNGNERRNDIKELSRVIQESFPQRVQFPKVDVPLFDGNNASGWAEKFEQLASCREWTDAEMLQKVKRYCKVRYKEQLMALVSESKDWAKFKEKLLNKYQLEDQLLDLADLRKVLRRMFGSTRQFLTKFERIARLIPDLSDKDKCIIFLDNFSEVEQREFMKDMQGQYDWQKIKVNILAGNFDQMLYRLLKQRKEYREEEDVNKAKDREVFKTLSDMREIMADMHVERLKMEIMMVKAKGSKRKGKEVVVESSSDSESEEEEPPKKLTKAERKALNQIQGGQGTSKKQGKNGGNGGNDRNAQAQPDQSQPGPSHQKVGGGRGRGRGNFGGRGNWAKDLTFEEEEPRRKKNIYTIPVEKGIDIEQIVDRILGTQRDLVTLKEFLAASPKIRDEIKQRLTRRKIMIVKLGDIIPPEANWAPAGTKMNWRCVVTGLLKVHAGQGEFTALMDDGAETNIVREKEVMEAGIRINRADTGFLIGASGSTVFFGMPSDVMV
ncbi:hypothetical protein CBR_g46774 [Chara braunii]|uniref:Peptidase A2 domain-containing protein n=1 Tax=Chara braunii TaxID=69332 RepID=A0A388M0Y5_CHABU|nr:hypothetical protein CBR_g46774 [Chara braunii]|eukprot:GBG88206.1 hypothetical protein CBR_g46774 [Chara braunii]